MNTTAGSVFQGVGRSRWLVILPAAFIMYTISFFDRANIGMALPYIVKEMGLTPVQAGMIGSSFAWGYVITQLAGGYLALKFNPRRLIGMALVLFGGAAIATGLVRNYHELLAVRVVLGLAEGPIYAATAMFLAQWFMKPERGRAFGIFNLALPAGAFLAGPVSGMILAHYDWRVMMIVEGLPAWLFCAVWFFVIPKNFESAKWLSDTDRQIIQDNLRKEQAAFARPEADKWWTVLAEPVVWLLTIGVALNGVLMYGMTLWLPSIIKSYGGVSEVMVGFYSGLPYLASMVGIYYISQRSDRHGQERRWHAAIPTMMTGLFMMGAAFVPAGLFYLQILMFVMVGFTVKMLNPLIYARLTEILPTSKAIPAVAMVSGLGNFFGQVMGPLVVGHLKTVSDGFAVPLTVLGLCAVMAGIFIALAKKTRAQGANDSADKSTVKVI